MAGKVVLAGSFPELAPGCERDLAAGTALATDVPFFNDEAAAQSFAAAGIGPLVRKLPAILRVLDLGGGDGFLAAHVERYLTGIGRRAQATVIDANVQSLLLAQGRGLEVVPANLEQVEVAPANLLIMRLVNHYNGYARQRAIFQRAWRNTRSGGYLVVQAECGGRAVCALRNLAAMRLDHGRMARQRHAERCEWRPASVIRAMMQRAGYEAVLVNPAFAAYEMPLRSVLALAWARTRHAAQDHDERDYAAFIDDIEAVARRRLARGHCDGLTTQRDGSLTLRSEHALLVGHRAPA